MDKELIKIDMIVSSEKGGEEKKVERIYEGKKWAKVVDVKNNAEWKRVSELEEV